MELPYYRYEFERKKRRLEAKRRSDRWLNDEVGYGSICHVTPTIQSILRPINPTILRKAVNIKNATASISAISRYMVLSILSSVTNSTCCSSTRTENHNWLFVVWTRFLKNNKGSIITNYNSCFSSLLWSW